MLNERNFFDQRYDNIQKIATSQGDDYTTGCLQEYLYFKN